MGTAELPLSDLDFKAASHDGYGEDWPLSYEDLEPYYDIVERYVGISGAAEGNPTLPDSHFLPPMKMTCGEVRLREHVQAKFGRTVTIGRTAILTQNHNGRAACHYCGPCERGCVTFSYFSSPFTTVADALKTGNCTLITNAVVRSVDMDNGDNRATGVTYIDRLYAPDLPGARQDRDPVRAGAGIDAHPAELIHARVSQGAWPIRAALLGHYLMDHAVGGGRGGRSAGVRCHAHSGQRAASRQWHLRDSFSQHCRTDRGIRASFAATDFRAAPARASTSAPRDSARTTRKPCWRAAYGIDLGAFGESLARFDNYCEIDPEMRDAWGIPALRIQMTHGDNEKAMMEDAASTAAEMLEAAGARNIKVNADLAEPGMAIHETGTARMGADPKKSVLDPYNQTHDVKNLFVMDGACYPSSACQNPTLTFMALTVRACDRLIDRFRKNEV